VSLAVCLYIVRIFNATSRAIASDGNFTNNNKKESFILPVKRQERIKNAQASKITVLACLDVRLRSPKTVISVIGNS
jgi:hypothetical protein